MKKIIKQTHDYVRAAAYMPLVLFAGMIVTIIMFVSWQANQPQKQDKKVTITLTVQEVDVVLGALQKLPYEQSASIIQSIYGQASKQLQDTATKKR